ncbi:hypothetical protein ACKI10_40735 [Streptomyces galilaeus]|uniref:hypothetical protein n=1 Tax=Streptomyces galilaeus TaxID=33899 RepID=UPI0038F639E5
MDFLFQRGKVHGIFGDTGMGKTWAALGAASEFLKEGETVTWFCFDCEPGSDRYDPAKCMAQLSKRLGLLGVADNQRAHFHHYACPGADWWPFQQYETSPTGLVVYDGIDHAPGMGPRPGPTTSRELISGYLAIRESVPTVTVIVISTVRQRTTAANNPTRYTVSESAMVMNLNHTQADRQPTKNTFRIV